MADPVQRRLAAILAADVAGYSRLMGADEEGTLAALTAHRHELIEPRIAEHRGRVVKTTGDGLLAEFASVVDAMRCAVAFQEGMRQRNTGTAEDRRIEFRIGVNLGDVIVQEGDVYGEGVNVAARLESLAEPGGICISGSAFDQIKNKLPIGFEDIGAQEVKNIADPVHVYRIRPAGEKGAGTASFSSNALFRRPAVAVLPFDNLSGDPEQQYFADGLTEDIITALARWRLFPVIARNSTFAYKGQPPDVRRIAVELGAHYVLEGSVRRGGNRVRVTVQLIDAATGHHVWAERYDRELQDIFALQDDMTLRIAAIIEPAIEQAEYRRIAAKHPDNLNAWENCIRGFSYIHEATKDGNASARELFERAIAQDPRYPRAYTGLAYTYLREVRFGWSESVERSAESAFEAARRAIALDGSDSEPRTMLVRGYQMVGQFDAAIAEGRRAVDLNPYDAYARVVLGNALMMFPEHREEAISSLKRGLELSPQDPQNFQIRTFIAVGHLCTRRYELAADLARTSARDNPEFIESHIVLAAALGHLDRVEEARMAMEKFRDTALEYIARRPTWTEEMRSQVLGGLRKAGFPE